MAGPVMFRNGLADYLSLHTYTKAMRLPSLILLPAFATIGIQAQVLDASNVPVVGDEWTYVNCGTLSLDGTGTDQTWDASTATSNGPLQGVQCMDPENTTVGAEFPEAELALVYPGTTVYLRVEDDGMYVVGSYNGSFPITSFYTDPLKQFVFPAELGDSWTDAYEGGYTFDGDAFDQNGQITATLSGVGDLILPWGTVENVLRMDIAETYTEEGSGNTFVMERTITEFYRPGVRTYLARLYSTTTELNGTPGASGQGFLYVEEDVFAGMAGHTKQAIGMDVLPNPATTQATVLFVAKDPVQLTLVDASGRVVHQRNIPGPGGLCTETLDLENLNAGVYTVRVMDSKGGSGTSRLVVTE